MSEPRNGKNKPVMIVAYGLLCALVYVIAFVVLQTFLDKESAQTISTGMGLGVLGALIYFKLG